MDVMELLRMLSVLGGQGMGPQQEEPNLGSNMPGSPMVMNAQDIPPVGQTPNPTMPLPSRNPVPPGMQAVPQPPMPYEGIEPPLQEGPLPTNENAPYRGIEPPVTGSYPGEYHEPSPFDKLMEIYSRRQETPANDALMRMYENYPQREKPGMFTRILGAMAAMGPEGLAGSERVIYGPHYRMLEDYMGKLKPLEIAARSEDRAADNNRMMLLGAMQRMTASERAGSYGDLNSARILKMEAEIEQMVANQKRKQKEYELRDWIARHPKHEFKWDRYGNLHAIDPISKKEDTISGIDGLTEEDKQMFIQNRQLNVEEARGENAIERVQEGGWSIQTVTGADGKTRSVWANPKTKAIEEIGALKPGETLTRPGTTGQGGAGTAKPMSWTQRIARIKANYVKIISDNPEFQAKFRADPITGLPILRRGHKFTPADKDWLSRRLNNGIFDDTGTPVAPVLPEEGEDLPDYVKPSGAMPAHGATVPAGTNTPVSQAPSRGSVVNPNKRGATLGQPPAVFWMLAPDGKTKGKVAPGDVERLKKKGYTTTTPPPGQG